MFLWNINKANCYDTEIGFRVENCVGINKLLLKPRRLFKNFDLKQGLYLRLVKINKTRT